MTYEEFIGYIQKLDKSKEYVYYSGRGSYKILDVSDDSVQIQVLESDETKKTISIQKEKIESFLKELKTGKPVYPNDVTKGSGSYRAIAPSLLCLTPRIFFVDIKNNRHLIELSEEHELGEMTLTKKNHGKNFNKFDNNRILFGAPGTGKSFTLKQETAFFENQERVGDSKVDNEDSVKKEVAEAIASPKGRKLTSLNAIGFKYADFWKKRTHLNKQEIKSFCNYPKIREIYVGAIAKFILDSDVLKMTEEELSDIAYIKALLHDDEKRGENDKLKWANAIGYKIGETDDFANLSLKDIETDLGLKGAQVWWLYRGIQAARLKEDEESVSEEPFIERVTFHPNYSFAQFVGTYKPVQDDEDEKQIKYEYVPGPFMRVYRNAKKNPNNNFLLIIEEIN